jgi:putative DNA primase/helicase
MGGSVDSDDQPLDPKAAEDNLLRMCAEQPETDIGNGRRFRLRYGDLAREHADRLTGAASHIAICVANIGWHVFDGTRWKEDEDGSLIRPLAHRTAEAIRMECALIDGSDDEKGIIQAGVIAAQMLDRTKDDKPKLPDPEKAREKREMEQMVKAAEATAALIEDRRAARARHAKSAAGSSKLTNALGEAQPYCAARVQDLNTMRLSVNCLSGTIDFVREEDEESDPDDPRYRWKAILREHRPEDMITKLANVRWQPGARPDAPEFMKFLKMVQPDPLARAFLKRFCGYLLTGLTVEQVILFFYGAGRNGKSTFVDLICHIMDDYAVTLSIDSFAGEQRRGGGEATPDLARLPGARLVAASEPEANVKLKDALIKTLTGGEKIPVRRLHKDFFEVDPHFKIILSGNHKPRIDDDSDGIWRRVLMVPWLVQVPKEKVDRLLPQKLRAEADAVFAWMVEGAVEYLSEGLNVPDSVRAASDEYRQESDAVGTFVRLACVVTGNPEDREKPLDLFMAYEKFADEEGVFKFNRATFEKRFAKAADRSFEKPDGQMGQFAKARSNGQTFYRGIVVRAEWRPGQGGATE